MGSPALSERELKVPAASRRLFSSGSGGHLPAFAPTIALVVLLLGFSLISPQFHTLRNLQGILDTASILAVVTVGTTFVLLIGGIDLSMEGVIAACVLIGALLVANSRNGNHFGVLGVVVTILVGATFGLLNGILSTRLRIPSLMTTLGVSALGLGVGTILFAGKSVAVSDAWLASWATAKVGGFTAMTFVAAAAVAIGWLIQRYSRVGRYAYAIGGAEAITRLSGLRVDAYKTALFTLAGAFYGLGAAMLISQLGSGVVQAGAGLNFSSIAAAVVGGTLLSGGRGGVLHSTIGVLLLTVLGNGLVLIGVSPYIQNAVQGVIVVLAVGVTSWPLRYQLGVVK